MGGARISRLQRPFGARSSVAERLVVVQEVAGSTPVGHPTFGV